MGEGVGRVAQALAGEPDHAIGNVDAMNLLEVAAHGTHEAARTAPDLESRIAGAQRA